MEHTVRDAHTHFFSRSFFDSLARLAPGGRPEASLLAEVAQRARIELPPEDNDVLLERWIDQMEANGIASMVAIASLPEEAAVVAEATATAGGRLTGYTVMNPTAPGAGDFAEHALAKLGLRGLVFLPALHHYHLSDESYRPVLERLRVHRGVAVVHCGILRIPLRDHFGIPRTYDARFASPLSLVRAASEFPDVPFVIPHFGGGMFQETLLAGAWCANILVDSSSSNDWMRAQVAPLTLRDVFARALDVFGPTRILFGTDSSTFPRGYRRDVLEAQRQALDDLGLSDEEREAIFAGNLERLLA